MGFLKSRNKIDPQCSFCGKFHNEVSKLVAGPGIYICDECVLVCCEIMVKELPNWPEHVRPPVDPLQISYEVLLQMRDSGEISEQIFNARLAEAAIRQLTPALPSKESEQG
jgi:hypothetical protein